ncbi:MAG: glycosyltransferase family 4 protein, partial [Opitutaceae bacterium]|nr:glycosyltransferase family 4 protein [Opitutaceae bacterium]
EEELFNLYRAADIFAMTSINYGKSVEAFGLVYLEASAFALPIIAHDVGGVSEAVLHEETGFLISPGNPRALTEAFFRLITDKNLRMQLGQNGFNWAKKQSWQDSAKILLNESPPSI